MRPTHRCYFCPKKFGTKFSRDRHAEDFCKSRMARPFLCQSEDCTTKCKTFSTIRRLRMHEAAEHSKFTLAQRIKLRKEKNATPLESAGNDREEDMLSTITPIKINESVTENIPSITSVHVEESVGSNNVSEDTLVVTSMRIDEPNSNGSDVVYHDSATPVRDEPPNFVLDEILAVMQCPPVLRHSDHREPTVESSFLAVHGEVSIGTTAATTATTPITTVFTSDANGNSLSCGSSTEISVENSGTQTLEEYNAYKPSVNCFSPQHLHELKLVSYSLIEREIFPDGRIKETVQKYDYKEKEE